MAEQPNIQKRRAFQSGLADHLGGDGKIQYETSSSSSVKAGRKSSSFDPSFLHLCVAVIIFACTAEYFASSGSCTLIIGLIVSALYSARSRPHDNIPMGDGYVPFFGHSLNVVKHWHDFFEEEVIQFLKLGKDHAYYSASLPLGKNFIFLVDPKLVDLLFRVKFGDADKGPEIQEILAPLLGKGIFPSDGKMWKKHRSIASRMFTVRSLRDYMFEVFVETTDRWIQKCEEIQKENGYVDMYDMYNRLTLEAFTQVAFGVRLGTIECAPKEVEFSRAFDDAFHVITKRFFDVTWPLQRFLNIGREKALKQHTKVINDFANRIIRETKANFQQTQSKKPERNGPVKTDEQETSGGGQKKRYDLMSLFLKDDPDVTNEELRDVALNFILAGRDTTAQLLSWFSYAITQNGEVEKKIVEEINQYVGDNGHLDYNVVGNCQYLENSFLESLRLRPSLPHLVRYAKVDIPLPNGDVIRGGDGIIVPTYAMGRMPWIWKEPDKFNPDRFKDQTYAPYQYPAFNLPPRMCLGKHVALLEAKIAIIKLFKKYKLEALPDQDVAYEFSVTNHMKNGFKVRLIPR
mmetsp:Transcript_20084/g.31897  ORF Transcript_20084/g.31897 Transcript_20084/m.31897 type:complete len:574 (-) Transcript_20084:157-1878(-)